MQQLTHNRRWLVVTRWSLALAFAVLMLWLTASYMVATGTLNVSYTVQGAQSPLIKNFASKESDVVIATDKKTNEHSQLITKAPVYFDVKTSRDFPKATVTLRYKNPDNQPVIKLGVVGKNGGIAYRDLAVFNSALDTLPNYWDQQREGDILFAQRNPAVQQKVQQLDAIEQEIVEQEARLNEVQQQLDAYGANAGLRTALEKDMTKRNGRITVLTEEKDSLSTWLTHERPVSAFTNLQEFFDGVQQSARVVSFRYDVPNYRRLPEYRPASETTVITNSMRGPLEINTYVKDESLDFTFAFQDINRKPLADEFEISVYHEDTKIKTVSVPDDGVAIASGVASDLVEVPIVVPNAVEGVYRIRIESRQDEIFVRKITTRQHLLVFKDRIYLTDNDEYRDAMPDILETPTTVWSSGSRYSILTSHEKGIQSVRIGASAIAVTKTNLPFVYDTGEKENSTVRIVSPKNDISIDTNGYFAFSENQLFNPQKILFTVSELTDATQVDDFDFIVASYPEKAHDGEWYVAQTTMEVPNLYTDNGTIHFLFQLPDLHENKRTLYISKVSVQLQRPPLTLRTVFSRIARLFRT